MLVNSFHKKIAVVVAATCALSMSALSVSAEPEQSTVGSDNVGKPGFTPGTNFGGTGITPVETSSTGSGITAKEAEVTELDTAGSEEEDYYETMNKQQLQLFQQHEAVQHFNAAQHYMKKWNTELAELELRAAIMYMPELRIAHRDYCMVALLRGKPLRALAEFFMVIGLAEPIPLTEQQQQELRTEASQAHYKKGLEEATAGKWDEAITELLWSRTYLPKDVAIHRSLAFAYASKGDFKMAEEYYKSTFTIDPGDAMAHADFAFLLNKGGKKAQALVEMSKAVKADPDAPALHVDLGWLAESKGDLKTAEAEFRAALARSPQYATLWMHLGQILEKRGRTADAQAAYKTALEKEPSNDLAKAAVARLGGVAVPTPSAQEPAVTPLIKPEAAQSKPVSTISKPAADQVSPVKPAPQATNGQLKPVLPSGKTGDPGKDTSKQTKL